MITLYRRYSNCPVVWISTCFIELVAAFLGMIINPVILLPRLCTLLPWLGIWMTKDWKFVEQFSERKEVSEDGIIFFIKNEFLEQCRKMLERVSLQVEEVGVDELLCKFTPPKNVRPTDSLPIEDHELRTIEVVDDEERAEEESSEDDEW